MELVADILLTVGSISAAVYCMVLGRRLKRFNDLEKGVGGAVAVLSAQVDDLTKTLSAAQKTSAGSVANLEKLADRAENTARNLELQMASLHDVPPHNGTQSYQQESSRQAAEPMFVRHRSTEPH